MVHKYPTHTYSEKNFFNTTICYLEETCLKYAKRMKIFLK